MTRRNSRKSLYILCNCIFMQLRGNDIVVNFQGNIFIQRTYVYSQKIYSFKEIIFVQKIIFISRKLSVHSWKLYSFKELSSFKTNIVIQGNIFIQDNYIHSSPRIYVHSRKLYSFNNVAFADIAEIFIQQVSTATL